MARLTSVVLALVYTCPVLAEDEKRLKTPQEAFEAFQAAMLRGDFDGVWGFFTKATREHMVEEMAESLESLRQMEEAELEEAAKALGLTVEEVRTISQEEFARKMMAREFRKFAEDKEEREKVEKTKWKSVEVDGARAVATVIEHDGKEDKFVLLLEDGEWRMDMDETVKLREIESGK